MEIKGKVHCFFEQSGTFKNEFIKLGIPAEDYDIQNNFGQTDHTDDLFAEIDKAYDGQEFRIKAHRLRQGGVRHPDEEIRGGELIFLSLPFARIRAGAPVREEYQR